MSARHYNLPPLKSLAAFEAAARHMSFKRAADELNVTPGAVSHQIKALEGDLGQELFQRVHRGVALTSAGEQLFRAMRGAFLEISETLRDLRGRSHAMGVTIGATTAMSALWLTPAISRFWREHPDVRINQVVSDVLDFGSVWPELVISYGPYDEMRYSGAPLFRDILIPVCSPELAQSYRPQSINDLAAMPLVRLDAPDARWTGWEQWFAECGYKGPIRRGIKVNNYMIALQAAQDGVGLVLGWRKLISPFVLNETLVSFDEYAVPAPTSFFLSRNDLATATADIDALWAWIRDAGKAS